MTRAIGLGCMRLSTEPTRPDAARARTIIDAAIAAGVTLVDTADAYCLSSDDVGHNERLLAGAPPHVRIVTKGGLTRPDGAWVPNGRAKHLAASARASRERLGRIDLYLLHAPDPSVPLATSVRALAKLLDDEVVAAIGLSNVNLTQLEAALAIAPIAAVEVELHPAKLDAIRGGLLAACTDRGIELLAHRPFGGPRGVVRLSRNAIVARTARRLSCSPAELILAWLRSLSPMVVPLPGASRIETAVSAARVIELDDDAKRALDDEFPTRVRSAGTRATGDVPAGHRAVHLAGESRTAADVPRGEVVVLMGIPGAGKSTLARDLIARGHTRFNRDERGGTLIQLARALDAALANGTTHAVLDNTYASRASRQPIIDIAHRHGLVVRCILLDTPIARAQHNAVARMLEKHGRLLEPAELRGDDIGPGAQFRWLREYEPPGANEGFDAIEIVPFATIARSREAHDAHAAREAHDGHAAREAHDDHAARTRDDRNAREAHDDHAARARDDRNAREAHDGLAADAGDDHDVHDARDARAVHDAMPALLVELDDIVWRGRPRTIDKIALRDGALDAVRAWHRAGFAIAATSWQPGVPPTTFAALVAALGTMLDVPLRASACFHLAGPPVCWCRKPLPGLAMAMAMHHRLRYVSCVGSGAADKGFAARVGVPYHDVREGWPRPGTMGA